MDEEGGADELVPDEPRTVPAWVAVLVVVAVFGALKWWSSTAYKRLEPKDLESKVAKEWGDKVACKESPSVSLVKVGEVQFDGVATCDQPSLRSSIKVSVGEDRLIWEARSIGN